MTRKITLASTVVAFLLSLSTAAQAAGKAPVTQRASTLITQSLTQARTALSRLTPHKLPRYMRAKLVINRALKLHAKDKATVTAPHGFTRVEAKSWSFNPGTPGSQTGIPDVQVERKVGDSFFKTSWAPTHKAIVKQVRHEKAYGLGSRVLTRAVSIISGGFIEKADFYTHKIKTTDKTESTQAKSATRFYEHKSGRRKAITRDRYHELLLTAKPLERLSDPNIYPPRIDRAQDIGPY